MSLEVGGKKGTLQEAQEEGLHLRSLFRSSSALFLDEVAEIEDQAQLFSARGQLRRLSRCSFRRSTQNSRSGRGDEAVDFEACQELREERTEDGSFQLPRHGEGVQGGVHLPALLEPGVVQEPTPPGEEDPEAGEEESSDPIWKTRWVLVLLAVLVRIALAEEGLEARGMRR